MNQAATQNGDQRQTTVATGEAGLLDQIASATRFEHDDRPQTLESEQLEIQVVTARRFPRSIRQFMIDAESMVTISEEMAAACFYSVPRAGKTISGPSVRLAEICMSAWGHLDAGTRVKEIGQGHILVEGFAWDMQKNNKVRQEVRRNITTSAKGSAPPRRYSEDMITTTINAAASIALRNAIYRIIPRAYVDTLMNKARQCAMGDIKTLASRRESAVAWWVKAGVLPERIWAALEIKGIEDITLEHLLTLKGFHTAVQEKEATLDECFPDPNKPAEKVPGELPSKRGTVAPAAETPKPEAPKADTKPAAKKEPAKPEQKPGNFTPAAESQLDEIEIACGQLGWKVAEAIKGQMDSTGHQMTSSVQLSKDQATAVLAMLDAEIVKQKAQDESEGA